MGKIYSNLTSTQPKPSKVLPDPNIGCKRSLIFCFQVRDLRVNCVAFSDAPEGLSVNVVAGGLDSGAVRLWSAWDLRPLRDICWEPA